MGIIKNLIQHIMYSKIFAITALTSVSAACSGSSCSASGPFTVYTESQGSWDCGDGKGSSTDLRQDLSTVPKDCCRMYKYKYEFGSFWDQCYDNSKAVGN